VEQAASKIRLWAANTPDVPETHVSKTHPPQRLRGTFVVGYWKKIAVWTATSAILCSVTPNKSRNILRSWAHKLRFWYRGKWSHMTVYPPLITQKSNGNIQARAPQEENADSKITYASCPPQDWQASRTFQPTIQDSAYYPMQQQLQWRAACQDELEALQKRQKVRACDFPKLQKQLEKMGLNQKMDWMKWPDCGQWLFTSQRHWLRLGRSPSPWLLWVYCLMFCNSSTWKGYSPVSMSRTACLWKN